MRRQRVCSAGDELVIPNVFSFFCVCSCLFFFCTWGAPTGEKGTEEKGGGYGG